MAKRIEEFTARMVQRAQENETAMMGLDPAAQVKFIKHTIQHNDAVFGIFPSEHAPLGRALYVVTGAEILAGSGFDLQTIETAGRPNKIFPRVIQRDLRLTAFIVKTYLEARYLDIAYGDSNSSRQHRKAQQRDGGKQAVENMRHAATPYGRAFAASNPHPKSALNH